LRRSFNSAAASSRPSQGGVLKRRDHLPGFSQIDCKQYSGAGCDPIEADTIG